MTAKKPPPSSSSRDYPAKLVAVIKFLSDGHSATINELCQMTGLCYNSVLRLLRHLRAQDLVYVGDYDVIKSRPTRVWFWGKGKDKKYVRKVPTKAERARFSREWRRREKERALAALAANPFAPGKPLPTKKTTRKDVPAIICKEN